MEGVNYLYCCDKLYSRKVEHLSFVSDFIELCVAEIRSHQRTLFIVAIHRPPNGNFDLFCGSIMEMLNDPLLLNREIFITGDLNIDLLKY